MTKCACVTAAGVKCKRAAMIGKSCCYSHTPKAKPKTKVIPKTNTKPKTKVIPKTKPKIANASQKYYIMIASSMPSIRDHNELVNTVNARYGTSEYGANGGFGDYWTNADTEYDLAKLKSIDMALVTDDPESYIYSSKLVRGKRYPYAVVFIKNE